MRLEKGFKFAIVKEKSGFVNVGRKTKMVWFNPEIQCVYLHVSIPGLQFEYFQKQCILK